MADVVIYDVSYELAENHTDKIHVPNPHFACSSCGHCCRQLQRHALYRELDRGDGICRHFSESSNLCTIYESRPDLCRIDQMYEALFAAHMTRSDYHAATHAACLALQSDASASLPFPEP
ncbi:YkgJ family cysteine cluster protein [Skermanella sp. TT6]|uniref:YkgJ family cysteine cluster protein n=1 Tax=Skermanella cutis TaxID=2775420 RepID=A0ABX7AZK6_9PROT|nr:YkgJ family cysteine cluster protein [Skermanella sp. TT6]QQP87508.1 YkgJ family cysteine cluster protein [Skermanella sp. TT6]